MIPFLLRDLEHVKAIPGTYHNISPQGLKDPRTFILGIVFLDINAKVGQWIPW